MRYYISYIALFIAFGVGVTAANLWDWILCVSLIFGAGLAAVETRKKGGSP